LGMARVAANHVFMPGAHLHIDSGGALVPIPFPDGRIDDLIAAAGTSDFLALARPSPSSQAIYLYSAGTDGAPPLIGGGRTATGSAFFTTYSGLDVLVGGQGCTVGWAPLGGLIAGSNATCISGVLAGGLMAYANYAAWSMSSRHLYRYPVPFSGPTATDRHCW